MNNSPSLLFFIFLTMTTITSNSAIAATKKLPLCPNSPNCVSSQAQENDKEHYIAPFKIISNAEETWTELKNIFNQQPRTVISKESDEALEIQVRSLIFRFVDDLHIMLDRETKLIHIRSASRTGHSDFGVNRKRVENLRSQLQQAGFIQ